MAESGFDLSSTYAHLGLGARCIPLPGFTWTDEYLKTYAQVASADGIEGRLVCITPQDASWDTWERHPAGEELVVLLSGRVDIIQERKGGKLHTVELHPGEAMVNPRGVWHTADVHEPGEGLFITPGMGTEHRDR